MKYNVYMYTSFQIGVVSGKGKENNIFFLYIDPGSEEPDGRGHQRPRGWRLLRAPSDGPQVRKGHPGQPEDRWPWPLGWMGRWRQVRWHRCSQVSAQGVQQQVQGSFFHVLQKGLFLSYEFTKDPTTVPINICPEQSVFLGVSYVIVREKGECVKVGPLFL